MAKFVHLCGLYIQWAVWISLVCHSHQALDDTGVATTLPGMSAGDDESLHADGMITKYVRLDVPMKNLTKYEGEVVRIKCEITGDPIPQYRWYKAGKVIHEDRRIAAKTILYGSKLKIAELTVADSGLYQCEGNNGYGKAHTSGWLTVLPGPNPNPGNSKNDDGPDDGPDELPPLPDPEIDMTGAENKPNWQYGYRPELNPSLFPDDHGDGSDDDSSSGDGFCQPYRGAACSKYVANKSIYVKNKFRQGHMEERLTAAFTVIATSSDLSPKCGEFAIPSLCYNAFPLCDDSGRKPQPRQICRDECEMLENNLCRAEYILAKSHPLLGNDFVLPNCELLPETGSPESDNCVRIGIPTYRTATTRTSHHCYNGTGQTYRGRVSTTRSGLNCQKWTTAAAAVVGLADFPELGDHNYCRNPGNQMSGPWCFTTDPSTPRQLCDVQQCPAAEEQAMSEILMILVPSVAVPIALGLILVIVCLCKRKNAGSDKPGAQRQGNGHVGGNMELNAMLDKPGGGMPGARAREIPSDNFRFLQELGEGTYGKVYQGELIGYHGDSSVHRVAVKTLMAGASQKMKEDFCREADTMSELKHPHLVCLLGACLKSEPPLCLLYEFPGTYHGNLHQYLLRRSPHAPDLLGNSDVHDYVHSNHGAEDLALTAGDLQYAAAQVASGLEYLAAHRIVHRDVAARNVIVSEKMQVKMADLGLAPRDPAYAADYYRSGNAAPLPIRWMPPEVLVYGGKFSQESDVWSFGVLLWEMFTFGQQPYCGLSNQEVIVKVRSHDILPSPDDCPSRIYTLMVECWSELPTRRPTFKEIAGRLRGWQSDAAGGLGGPAVGNLYPALGSQYSSSSHSGHHSAAGSGAGANHSTNTTGLSGGSAPGYGLYRGNQQTPSAPPQQQGFPIPPPPLPPSVIYSHYNTQRQQGQLAYPSLYKKPSPPGSTAGSHKSSSVPSSHSPASSVSNFKPVVNGHNGGTPHNGGLNGNGGGQYYQKPQHHGGAPSGNGGMMYSPHSPTTQNNINMMNSYNKMHNNVNAPQQAQTPDMYIPDSRTSDI